MSQHMSKASKDHLGYIGRKPGAASRDSDSWFTPSVFIDAARDAMGGVIDFDPFSSDVANKTVRARKYFTQEDDALARAWPRTRNVWMNPPYSAKLCGEAVNAFCDEYKSDGLERGIVLVNNATETRWFQRMLREASAVCFPAKRIAFENVDGKKKSGNTRGQVFFFFGEDPTEFLLVFASFGATLKVPETRFR